MLIYATPLIPYHRLAAATANRLRPTLVAFALVAAVYTLVVLGLRTPDVNPAARYALDLAPAALLLPLTFLAVRWAQERRPGTLSSVQGQLRMRWLGICALVAVPAAVYSFTWPGWTTFVPMVMVAVALVPVQAAAEEYLFRGWLLQSIGAHLTSPWPAVGLQAVLFALVHGSWTYAVIGVVAGWLTVRTGGLEAAIAFHVVSTVVTFGQETAANVVFVVAYGLVVRWLAIRLRVGTRARGAASLTPLAEVSRRTVPTTRGPVLTRRSNRSEVSSSCGR
nr:CPBP family intramembrane glutamic endopeptidase [Cryptosporangium arvum]